MPVYIRKNPSIRPLSIDRVSDEDDEDYLLDPDQLTDVLPQPYRMINKILFKIFDDIWEIIEEKENKRLSEARKIKPPKHDIPYKLPIIGDATALSSSEDGKYLFAGLPNGLTVVDTSSNQILNQWDEDRAEINHIQAYNFSPNVILLVTMDDMAIARLFFFAFDCLLFVKVLNEIEGYSSKLLTSCCEASVEGDYIGIVFENPSTKEVWFEAYKSPREAWLSELETAKQKINKQKEKEFGEDKVEQDMRTTESTTGTLRLDAEMEQEKTIDSPRPPTPPSSNAPQSLSHKFSHPTMVFKVKPPAQHTANTSSSISSACQKVDATGYALGLGQTHIMSAAHLESRDATFQHIHPNLTKYMSSSHEERAKERQQDVMMATFHFCRPGRTFMTGAESSVQPDQTSCVILWWKGSNHLLQFSLLKVSHAGAKSTGSDLDHKPDFVRPFSSNITCSTVSSCTSHIAVGLANGNVVIWDRYMGLQRGVVNMSEKSCSVQMLRFLDPSLYPSSCFDYPPYPQRRGCYLVAQYKDSTHYIYDVGQNVHDQPVCVGEMPEKDDESQTLLQSIPDLPELCLVVQKDGTLFVKDVLTGVRVCQLALPSSYQIQSPWEPVISFGARGKLLYVKGSGEATEESEETTKLAVVFIFPLHSFKTLDSYWSKARNTAKLLVHPTIEDRLDALIKERLIQQRLRKNRIQMRWGLLRSDLAVIQNAREVNNDTVTKPFMTPSSGRSVPIDLLTNFKPSTVHQS